MNSLLASLLTIIPLGAFLLPPGVVPDERPALEFEQTINTENHMLLTLNIPSIDNHYYADDWEEIVNFHSRYAEAIQSPDKVQVLVNAKTRPLVEDKFTTSALVTAEVDDIWMRDFTMVNPYNPVQFAYGGGLSVSDARFIQSSFNKYARSVGKKFRKTDLILDGGNIVDNYEGKIITTDRFLTDNGLDYEAGKEHLKDLYRATSVAILPADDEALGHSDGMVMWADENILIVNKYAGDFRAEVLAELEASLPGIKIVEVDVDFDEKIYDEEKGIGSACGINLNSVLTETHIYVPTFGMTEKDQEFLKTLKVNTTKIVVPIDARGVCHMGGSVRCLSWQQGLN